MIGTIWKKKSSVFHKESYKAPIGIVVAVEEDGKGGTFITLKYGDGASETISHGILKNFFTPIRPTTPLPCPKE
mgnify:CR=1 FL=1